ncbi:acidic leucine-rich nuclear phosphoprotein 32 family member B-like isoform X3 [Physella acuta]|uniref:acidic leucine-rich nuclear phosphoprotein 32 family member B-like isoform X3 n=1 Tax=Physella acuta TaxID=109671 RepID=UPI0027DCF838|nr:acidic leucine-rich nuclear phosphoprotein 32 family member B-like isoform X3 [Physella acuta]
MKMSLGLGKRIELEMRGRPADQILDLNLDNCRASKIEGLTSEFVNLQTLSLINLGLQSLEGFPKLGNLRKLELSDNRISGGLNHLTGCPNLTHLSLSGNKIKDFDVLDPLKDLNFLRSLDLFNCEVTNNEQYREKVFAKLSQITYLDGFDREEKEQEDVDGEEEDEDEDENEVDDEDDDDDEDEDEVGLSYLTKNIDDDDEDEDDFEPGDDGEDDDDQIVAGEDDDEEEDDEVAAGEDDGDDEEEEGEGEEEEEEEGPRGTKRKHDEEEEGGEEEEDA